MKSNTIDSLSATEQERVKECLQACVSLLEDDEAHTLIGLSNEEMQEIVQNWPQNGNQPNTILAVNNCLNLLVNGFRFNDTALNELAIHASYKKIRSLYDTLQGINNLPPLQSKNDLIDYINQQNIPHYIFFWSSKGDSIDKNCLSQFYPVHFALDNVIYRSAEHYFMAEKARFFNDQESLDKILKSKSPLESKKLGRNVKNFNEEQWAAVRFEIVVRGNTAKFGQNSRLKEYLKSTSGKVLVEASPDDSIWGIGLAQDDPDAHNPRTWRGENLLGFALMKVRDELL